MGTEGGRDTDPAVSLLDGVHSVQSSEYEQLCVSDSLTYIVDEILPKRCVTKRDELVIYIPGISTQGYFAVVLNPCSLGTLKLLEKKNFQGFLTWIGQSFVMDPRIRAIFRDNGKINRTSTFLYFL